MSLTGRLAWGPRTRLHGAVSWGCWRVLRCRGCLAAERGLLTPEGSRCTDRAGEPW